MEYFSVLYFLGNYLFPWPRLSKVKLRPLGKLFSVSASFSVDCIHNADTKDTPIIDTLPGLHSSQFSIFVFDFPIDVLQRRFTFRVQFVQSRQRLQVPGFIESSQQHIESLSLISGKYLNRN